ncbi:MULTISPECIES: glycogen debranching protein GlgX [unclassified Rhizobium]|jgi:glycogen operon protein|uniref:glycogen debranching protein GlgX n=1 Tax=unclassified Rhizobium TaxID=2613769 RepID=UPI0006457F4F|nr:MULTISPECIES: glycogen debranching protein GlgX [unclassified Rhizobium]MBN8949551.1 glycogen debranching protein GlgX [Rhizobium tropici]OJY75334.1 MAG: glycogen debranching enzyme GlgX [Rhizobium sp. 60-20]RKD70663.1 glycogen operon protein [Rhizobium sp. WW_1]
MSEQTIRSLGATPADHGVEFAVWSRNAERIELCLFDTEGQKEIARLPLARDGDEHRLFVKDAKEGTRYGLRAHGTYDPEQGLWFDPSKLLIDPYAKELDRPFHYDPRLGIVGEDTQDIMPKAIVSRDVAVKPAKPLFQAGCLIYEIAVKPFTMLHPDVPAQQRGTVAALAHPAVIAHLKRLQVDAVELMPITAWIDERHLPPLGLTNGWGYNPVGFMALDPRLVPGGMKELRETVATLHAEGIAVILDLVFNHTGESDRHGPTLSLRGLDNPTYFRSVAGQPGTLVNDTGTGNTVACDQPATRRLILDSLSHFVRNAGIDGFRFDLATVLGRNGKGFDPDSLTLRAMLADEVLRDRIMIAEPWDIGPGGYQLGNFPAPFLEWNDRARDDLRRFWRGNAGIGDLATILAGSSPIFGRDGRTQTRSVNFLAAHDGFTLMDLVSYENKHNEANGENNRDGHNENFSWNNGVEGRTDDLLIQHKRRTDIEAMLSTLFATRGTIMLTAGDEGGRSQQGNNNAYCQDNAITWMDWKALDEELIGHAAWLAGLRHRFAAFGQMDFFRGDSDVLWFSAAGTSMTVSDWEAPNASVLGMAIRTEDRTTGRSTRLAMVFNRAADERSVALPASESGWSQLTTAGETPAGEQITIPARFVAFLLEY